jgi:hypothetical protein
MACDPTSGQCVPSGGCTTDTECPGGQMCIAGQCLTPNCATLGCPAGMTCDPASGDCVASAACRVSSDCPSGHPCVGGQCVASGCQTTGCPAGMACDPTSGQCIPAGCAVTGCAPGTVCDPRSGQCVAQSPGQVGNCFNGGGWMGRGRYSGNAGGVQMCTAAGLDAVSGGPDAAIYDSADETGQPATLFMVGDMSSESGTVLAATLDQCPAPGLTLSAPGTSFVLVTQLQSGDTFLYAQKVSSAGTISFSGATGGPLTVSATIMFGSQTVTASATLQPAAATP